VGIRTVYRGYRGSHGRLVIYDRNSRNDIRTGDTRMPGFFVDLIENPQNAVRRESREAESTVYFVNERMIHEIRA
jgi:hypothetical protein